MKSWRSILTLVAISSILPELLSGSTPIFGFLNIGNVIALIIGYGLAALVIREIAIRSNAGFGGVVLMGCAYGIFNEGLFSKTMIWATNLPLSQFNGYGRILGINFPWAFDISIWHALASVLAPILLTYFAYPNEKDKPWLTKTATIILGVVLMILGSLNFLGTQHIQGTVPQLLIFLIIMALLIFLGARLKNKNPHAVEASSPQAQSKISAKPVYLGFISILLFSTILLSGIAAGRLPLLVFYLVYFLGILGCAWIIKHNHWNAAPYLLLFCLGIYMETSLLSMIVGITQGGIVLIELFGTGIVAEIALILYARKTLRRLRIS